MAIPGKNLDFFNILGIKLISSSTQELNNIFQNKTNQTKPRQEQTYLIKYVCYEWRQVMARNKA